MAELEGRHASYVSHFKSIFPVPPAVLQVLYCSGNHDTGLYLPPKDASHAREQFRDAFGPLQGSVELSGHHVVWVDSQALLEERHLSTFDHVRACLLDALSAQRGCLGTRLIQRRVRDLLASLTRHGLLSAASVSGLIATSLSFSCHTSRSTGLMGHGVVLSANTRPPSTLVLGSITKIF